MTPIVTQVVLKKQKAHVPSQSLVKQEESSQEHDLYYKDVAGFFIFLLVVFTVLMIALYA